MFNELDVWQSTSTRANHRSQYIEEGYREHKGEGRREQKGEGEQEGEGWREHKGEGWR